MGGGAVYSVDPGTTCSRLLTYVELAGGKAHQIHIAFFSVAYRYGVVGFILLNLFSFDLMYKAYKLVRLAQRMGDRRRVIRKRWRVAGAPW